MASQVTDQLLNLNITINRARKEVTDLLIELEGQEFNEASRELGRFKSLETAETSLKMAYEMLDIAWESSRAIDRHTTA
jgi:hypothetical protein